MLALLWDERHCLTLLGGADQVEGGVHGEMLKGGFSRELYHSRTLPWGYPMEPPNC